MQIHCESPSSFMPQNMKGIVDLKLRRYCLKPLNLDECFKIKGQLDSVSKELNAEIRYYSVTLAFSCVFAITSHTLKLLF